MRILIVEDEPAAVKRMRKLLASADPGIVIIGEVDTVSGALEWFERNEAPDLAFFDIQLADGNAFEIFERMDVPCPVVFVTAYDEHALRAFRVNALDYLLKPVNQQELANVLERSRDRAVVRVAAKAQGVDPWEVRLPVRRFLLRYGDHIKIIEPDEIAYFFSQDKITYLRTREGRDLPMDESLDRLECQLDPHRFFRLNRKLIVQVDSIRDLITYSKSRVKVSLDPEFGPDAVVSSERASSFKRWLAGG
ncbi:MAG: response regulator transcription factor [Flavobacteriales bacterium]|nr:response regulator transcription factor [Flavobacteriales bacterium]